MARVDPTKVLWKEVDGLVVVLLISTGNFIEFNRIGSAIWKLLAEGRNVEEIVSTLAKLYDVSAEKLTADTKSFIDQMTTQGLLS